MKNECDIVKDLLPNYAEDLVSKQTKDYMENHINNCKQCKQALEIIIEDKNNNMDDERQEGKFEFKNLKKIKRKMLMLKLFSSAFVILIVIMILSFALKYIEFNSLVNNIKDKKEELISLDNYSIYTTSHHINYQTDTEDFYYDEYYFKDGKYKIISKSYGINRWRLDGTNGNDEVGITYGEMGNNEQIIINNNEKKIINLTTNSNIFSKIDKLYNSYNSFSFVFQDINNVAALKIGFLLNNDIQTARFNGKDCYVLRVETKEYYKEIWIDKENLLPIRSVQDIFGQLYDEKTLTFHKGNAEDEDLIFDQEQYRGYSIENKEALYEDEVINGIKSY